MPHHHGNYGTSAGVKQGSQKSTPSQSHHGTSKSTYVEPKKSTSISKKKDKPSLIPASFEIIKGIGEALTKGSKEYKLARRKRGRQSTILTGPLGIQEDKEEALDTLLG